MMYIMNVEANMYKVSEVAEMLSIGKIKIVEALILHDIELAPFIKKERHLTYISDQGVRKLESLLFTKHPETRIEEESLTEDLLQDNDSDGLDQLNVFIEKNEEKKSELRNEIIDLKRKLSQLDKDIKYMAESIFQAQGILNEDIKWTESLLASMNQNVDSQKNVGKASFFNKLKK